MERKWPTWLSRVGLVIGLVALAYQAWVSITFIRQVTYNWETTRPQLVSFAESANRFSQLKTPALKYPAVAIYFSLFVAGVVIIVGWLLIRGVRDAMTTARR
jgi:hypothetical protein